ncbi:ATP-dependent large subunit ribosomal RNA helicase DbpA-like protein [Psychroflexus torquis ATCC 700755]|uniref:ATP-dependent large subunit ribosomal RNA helicase DbpA-like protein n=1 Tax=Psychroflexus torquis (strain ATCC 700755 / CIP 106069 / ACAM 623) TaxID=313595 RepID=K4IIX0_PSYTT|nr:DEAD/DEAH box helicase [Psychroflexus torquis]AFU70314.1 ATP-dependent large subunit ribosomal RNA helicase DbpA-like protein [Psychroflexus torquis ATCC 700755]
MANHIKSQEDILRKLNIQVLNPMQEEAIPLIENTTNTILLSPTGTGKTLAFSLPLLTILDPESPDVQVLILVPSRELAIQIEQVIRTMGSGYKVNAVYGGRPVSKDKIEIKHNPAILIGTPGRILDHFNSERFSKTSIQTLILDEFDKSLEVGFEEEMKAIISQLPNLNKRVLTSATQSLSIPGFVRLDKPSIVNYLNKKTPSKLTIKTVISPSQSKLKTLVDLVHHLGNAPGIVFCNLRDSIDEVSSYLNRQNISHACFSGVMEQKDRERALIKFRNGSSQILVATDLAARGIDIPELKFIIHYELPRHEEEFIHRNGRTARVNSKGTAYILKWERESLPEFIKDVKGIDVSSKSSQKIQSKPQYWETLFISGGRKDKISKGDIAGLFFKQGGLNKDQLGNIELKPDCAFVAIPLSLADELVEKLSNSRLKKKKVRISVLES